MVTSIQIGIGLYLVGVLTLSGLVVHYLSREPMKRSIPNAAWWSGILAALVWPFIALWLVVSTVRSRLRARRLRRVSLMARLNSDRVIWASERRMRRAARRLDRAAERLS